MERKIKLAGFLFWILWFTYTYFFSYEKGTMILAYIINSIVCILLIGYLIKILAKKIKGVQVKNKTNKN